MNILGVDYGRKRVGLAIGDAVSGLVFPLRALVLEKDTDLCQAVIDAAKTENATRVVVGVPRRMRGGPGGPGDIEKEALAFVKELKEKGGLTVDVEDERLTTALAERLCESAGKAANTADKDSIAACAILESFILRTSDRPQGSQDRLSE